MFMSDEQSISQPSKKGPIEESIEMIRSQRQRASSSSQTSGTTTLDEEVQAQSHQASSSRQAPNPQSSVGSAPGVSASASSSPQRWQKWVLNIIGGSLSATVLLELCVNLLANWLTISPGGIFAPGTPLGVLFTFRRIILLVGCSLFLIVIALWQPIGRWGISAAPPQQATIQGRGSWLHKIEKVQLLAVAALVLLIVWLLVPMWFPPIPENVSVSFTLDTKVVSRDLSVNASFELSPGDPSVIIIRTDTFNKPFPPLLSSNATGIQNCGFAGIGCQTVVTQKDVNDVIAPVQLSLEAAINQELRKQVTQQLDGTLVSGVYFPQISPLNIISSPAIGQVVNSPTKEFTVTITQMQTGQVEYVDNSDVKHAIREELTGLANSQVNESPGYELIQQTLQMGPLIVPEANLDSDQFVDGIDLHVAAAANFLYHFNSNQLQAMQDHLAGQSVSDARKYLRGQAGIDPQSVRVDFLTGGGSNLPVDPEHIQLKPFDVISLPPIYLSPVALPSSPGS
jgi:hypothetical protein